MPLRENIKKIDMDQNIIYRKATPKDFEGLCQLRKQLATDPEDRRATEYAPYSEQNDRVWIKKCLKARRKFILIAEEKGMILAHAIILIEKISPKFQDYFTYHQKARLVHLYVDPRRRHQGIGENLMKYTLKYLQQHGSEFVDLECYFGNEKAEALYQKLGFKNIFAVKRYILR